VDEHGACHRLFQSVRYGSTQLAARRIFRARLAPRRSCASRLRRGMARRSAC